jgi:hypothetical protein
MKAVQRAGSTVAMTVVLLAYWTVDLMVDKKAVKLVDSMGLMTVVQMVGSMVD